jgi:NADPH:quinone reductase-like Zn-dependent oxidoreductase
VKAVVLREFGGPDVLAFEDAADPEAGPGEVRVRVLAIAVARTKDVSARAGKPPFAGRLQLPHILGTEHAGIVDQVGPGSDPGLLGARVGVSAVISCGQCRACSLLREEACASFGLVGVDRQGSYAEFCVVPAGNVHVLPDSLSFSQAAALAANGPVARAQLDAGGVTAGSRVLVLGAGGALGSAAAALAVHRDAEVIGVERLSVKPDQLDPLQLIARLDGDDDSLADKILALTDGWGVDCVIDNLGITALWNRYRPALADMGRIIVSGAISHEPIPMALLPFYLRSQSLIGVRTGNRTQMIELWKDVHSGLRLCDELVTTIPWDQIRDAHTVIENGTAPGQIIAEVA